MNILIQVLLGVLFANLVEVLAHKYILHGLGKKKNSFFSHHWVHHHMARKWKFYDPLYLLPFWNWDHRFKEVLGIVLLCILVFPFWFYFKIFAITLWVYALSYIVLHKYMHMYPKFGQKWFPWHHRHHVIGNQEHSWGVLLPIIDYILGTNK